MKNSAFQYYRSVLIFFILSFSQLFLLEAAQAQEMVQTGSNSVAQNNQSELQASNVKPTFSRVGSGSGTELENNVGCLALNIYFEARSEPELGQRAVGHVVMNRVAHPGYPSSVCEVVHQGGAKQLHRCQFSWWCDGLSDKPVNQKAWVQALQLAQKIYLGTIKDTTGGALWYHAIYAKPYWSKILHQGDRIGQHIFYLERRQSKIIL